MGLRSKQERQRNREEAQKQSRRNFLRRGALVLGGLAFAGLGTKYLFQEIIERQRQNFLNDTIGKTEIPYCSGVVYDHTGKKIKGFFKEINRKFGEEGQFIGGVASQFSGGDYDMKTPDIMQTAGMGESVPIFVGRQLFDSSIFAYCTPEDVRHILIAHEGQHCVQHAKGLSYASQKEIVEGFESGKLRPQIAYHIFEYDAYIHDLPRALNGEFKVSARYLEECKSKFIKTGHALTSASRIATPLELKLIMRLHEEAYKRPELRDVSIQAVK